MARIQDHNLNLVVHLSMVLSLEATELYDTRKQELNQT